MSCDLKTVVQIEELVSYAADTRSRVSGRAVLGHLHEVASVKV